MTAPTIPSRAVFAGSPLRRRTYALAALGLLALLFVLALTQIGRQFNQSLDVLRVLVTALLVTALLSLIPITILRYLDRRERESWWVMGVAFLWGGLIATGLALPLNTQVLSSIAASLQNSPELMQALGPRAPLLIGAPIAGPLVEETIKGLGVVVLFVLLRGEFDNMRDGFIYGALVGVGFTWFESALYIANGYAQCGAEPWGLQLGSRYALFGLAGHALYTGMFGMFLGLARQSSARWVGVIAPVFGLILAIAAHMIHNALPLLFALGSPDPSAANLCPPEMPLLGSFVNFTLMDLLLFAPALVIVGIGLWRSGIWERRVIREELKDEPGDIVTPDEYDRVERDHLFATRRIQGKPRQHMRALVNAQNEIAFRKRRLRRRGQPPDADALVNDWRDYIRALRAAGTPGQTTP